MFFWGSDEEDEQPLRDLVYAREEISGTDGDRERPSGSEDIEVNVSPIPDQSYVNTSRFNVSAYPEGRHHSDFVGEEGGKQIWNICEDSELLIKSTQDDLSFIETETCSAKSHEEIPPRIFQEPVPYVSGYHTTSLQSSSKTVVLNEEPNEGPANDISGAEISPPSQSVNSQPVSNISTQRRAREAFEAHIGEMERELNERTVALEKARWEREECKERVERIRKELNEKETLVQRLEEDVEAKRKKVNRFKNFLIGEFEEGNDDGSEQRIGYTWTLAHPCSCASSVNQKLINGIKPRFLFLLLFKSY